MSSNLACIMMVAVEMMKTSHHLDFFFFFKLEATKCDEGLHVGYQRKRGGSDGPKVFDLSKWKD